MSSPPPLPHTTFFPALSAMPLPLPNPAAGFSCKGIYPLLAWLHASSIYFPKIGVSSIQKERERKRGSKREKVGYTHVLIHNIITTKAVFLRVP